jgi:hypothetical protein
MFSRLQSLEALQPDVVLRCLRSSKPVVHEVVLDPSESLPGATTFLSFIASTKDLASGNIGENPDTEIVRVASLSATFEDQC